VSEPIRYTGKTEGSLLGSPHWEHPEGEWVKWEDYARLKDEVERLRKAGDAVALDYAERIEIEAGETAKTLMKIVPVLRDWNAAKEGKQP